MTRIIVGTAEMIEAEFGMTDTLNNRPFIVLVLFNNEPESLEGFETRADAESSLVDVEDRSLIETLF